MFGDGSYELGARVSESELDVSPVGGGVSTRDSPAWTKWLQIRLALEMCTSRAAATAVLFSGPSVPARTEDSQLGQRHAVAGLGDGLSGDPGEGTRGSHNSSDFFRAVRHAGICQGV